MRERVEQHGGRWRVRSVIGQGTTIEAEFPVSDTSSETAYNPEVVAMAAGVGA